MTPSPTPSEGEAMLAKAQYFVDCKYVARADERQKSMGLAYVEAERQDLAREIANFTLGALRAAAQSSSGVREAALELWQAVTRTSNHVEWFEPLSKLKTALDRTASPTPREGEK